MTSAICRLNSMSGAEMRAALERCCGAAQWVQMVALSAPFASREDVFEAAETAFSLLGPSDWLEAFAHHPRIGDIDALRAKFATLGSTKSWAGAEQAGTRVAPDEILRALQRGNEEYEARFGHLFIVCATGKSAQEMLELLNQRIGNEPAKELENAAAQQRLITLLRLEKLLSELETPLEGA